MSGKHLRTFNKKKTKHITLQQYNEKTGVFKRLSA